MEPEKQDQLIVETPEERAARQAEERREAEEIAQRYGLELVDMSHFRIDNDLFRSIPFDLMLRYGFLPESEENYFVPPGVAESLRQVLALGPLDREARRQVLLEAQVKEGETPGIGAHEQAGVVADASQEKFLTLFHVLDKHRDCRETLVSSDFPVFVFLL